MTLFEENSNGNTIVKCPSCKKTEVVRHGYDVKGNERFLCRNSVCQTKTFQLEYIYQAKYHEITNKIIEMAINSSGADSI